MIGPRGARDRRPRVLRAGSRPRGRVQLAVLPRRPQGGEAAEVAPREMGTHEWGECCSTRGGPGGRAGARDEEDLGWRSRRREGLRCGRGRPVSGWWSWRGPRGVAAVAVATWRSASHAVTGPALAAPCDPQRPATAPGSPAALRGELDAEEGAAGSDREGGCGAAPGVRGRAPRAPRAEGARREGSGELGAPEQVALARERRPSARTHSAPRSVRASRLESASVPPSLGFLIGEGVSHLCDTYRLGFLWELKRCRLSARGLLQLSRLALRQPGTPRPQVPRLWWWEVR